MEIPTLREETARRKVAHFRDKMLEASRMTAAEREALVKEMQAFCDSLSTGNVVLGGAGIGLGASILPVIGTISGPIIGGIYGAYKAHKLSHYRDEVLAMIRRIAR
jgi:Asp/Glu/hydantoin racemase